MERNWQEDWNMCKEASAQPWSIATTTDGYPILDVNDFEVAYSENLNDVRFIAEAREALPYWLKVYLISQEEIKELKNQLARANCEWQREKSLRHSLAAEVGKEKKRADEAEAKLKQIRGELYED